MKRLRRPPANAVLNAHFIALLHFDLPRSEAERSLFIKGLCFIPPTPLHPVTNFETRITSGYMHYSTTLHQHLMKKNASPIWVPDYPNGRQLQTSSNHSILLQASANVLRTGLTFAAGSDISASPWPNSRLFDVHDAANTSS